MPPYSLFQHLSLRKHLKDLFLEISSISVTEFETTGLQCLKRLSSNHIKSIFRNPNHIIYTNPNYPRIPDMLIFGLPLKKQNGKLRKVVKSIQKTQINSLVSFVLPSGCGKTRACYEVLCVEYGILLSPHDFAPLFQEIKNNGKRDRVTIDSIVVKSLTVFHILFNEINSTRRKNNLNPLSPAMWFFLQYFASAFDSSWISFLFETIFSQDFSHYQIQKNRFKFVFIDELHGIDNLFNKRFSDYMPNSLRDDQVKRSLVSQICTPLIPNHVILVASTKNSLRDFSPDDFIRPGMQNQNTPNVVRVDPSFKPNPDGFFIPLISARHQICNYIHYSTKKLDSIKDSYQNSNGESEDDSEQDSMEDSTFTCTSSSVLSSQNSFHLKLPENACKRLLPFLRGRWRFLAVWLSKYISSKESDLEKRFQDSLDSCIFTFTTIGDPFSLLAWFQHPKLSETHQVLQKLTHDFFFQGNSLSAKDVEIFDCNISFRLLENSTNHTIYEPMVMIALGRYIKLNDSVIQSLRFYIEMCSTVSSRGFFLEQYIAAQLQKNPKIITKLFNLSSDILFPKKNSKICEENIFDCPTNGDRKIKLNKPIKWYLAKSNTCGPDIFTVLFNKKTNEPIPLFIQVKAGVNAKFLDAVRSTLPHFIHIKNRNSDNPTPYSYHDWQMTQLWFDELLKFKSLEKRRVYKKHKRFTSVKFPLNTNNQFVDERIQSTYPGLYQRFKQAPDEFYHLHSLSLVVSISDLMSDNSQSPFTNSTKLQTKIQKSFIKSTSILSPEQMKTLKKAKTQALKLKPASTQYQKYQKTISSLENLKNEIQNSLYFRSENIYTTLKVTSQDDLKLFNIDTDFGQFICGKFPTP